MRNLPFILLTLLASTCIPFLSNLGGLSQDVTPVEQNIDKDPFEKAVEIIKKYETLHSPRHWPLVGYGHKVLPGEKYSRSKTLSEKEADALLRKDLLKNCAVFREFGADSLLLGVLAYNIGSGATLRSSVTKMLKNGNRDIRSAYLAHCRYKGKVHSQIQRRRIEEFETLFIENPEEKKLPGPPLIAYNIKPQYQFTSYRPLH